MNRSDGGRFVRGRGQVHVMRVLPVQAGCTVMLAAIWALDLVSPQLFVVAILLTAPVALSGIALRPNFTLGLLAAALVADGSAGWFNAYHDGRWQTLAVGDRLLAAFAIVLVGALTVTVQRAVLRTAVLAERNTRSEAIRDVIYAVSHDLRTPIMAARMTMRQALGGEYGALPDPYREILKRSIASNEDLHRLAETLLLVARYESGEVPPAHDDVDLEAVAQHAVDELEGLAQVRGIDLEARFMSPAPHVAADAGDLKRAVTNLLANALTWTPQGGHVKLELQAQTGEAVLRVRDDGYGVSEAARATLFERFAPGAHKQSGAGLGLYIVRRIAQAHGGSVSYEPSDPAGSTFTMRLPLYDRMRTL